MHLQAPRRTLLMPEQAIPPAVDANPVHDTCMSRWTLTNISGIAVPGAGDTSTKFVHIK